MADPANSEALPSYEPPSIKVSKEFLQANLPRRILDATQKTGYRLANDGELIDPATGREAERYDIWKTSSDAFDEFGIGISLYFKTLKGLFLVIFLCAFINLVAIYQNKETNPNSEDVDQIKF